GFANIIDQLLVSRAVQDHNHQVGNVAVQAARDRLQVFRRRGIQIDHAFAGRPDHELFHVAVGSVEQPTFFCRRQNGNSARRSGGAEVRSFQRIDGDVHLGDLYAIAPAGAYLLSDVEHGSFIALAFADDDGAAHGHLVHGAAHGLGGNLVGLVTIAQAHGVGGSDGCVFHNAHEFQRQLEFEEVLQTLVFGSFLYCLGRHKVPPASPNWPQINANARIAMTQFAFFACICYSLVANPFVRWSSQNALTPVIFSPNINA